MKSILNKFKLYGNKIALIDRTNETSYWELYHKVKIAQARLIDKSMNQKVILLKGDFDLNTIIFFIAAILEKNIVLPISSSIVDVQEIKEIIRIDYFYDALEDTLVKKDNANLNRKNLVKDLIKSNEGGIIFFSSGTTGKPKAIVHSAAKLFKKYEKSGKQFRTLAFLLFDHIAGIDTLMYTLSAGGTLITLRDRKPETVINTLRNTDVEVFPTSPSYLNIILLSDNFDMKILSSLKIITFGSERMPESTLNRLQKIIPSRVKLIQKYGITEIGSPVTKNKPDNPLWIKFKEGLIEYKIIDDVLWIKSESSMMGYLFNDKEVPFDGWFNTEDKVEVDGDWIKILGRVTDIINIGGQKVYPSEIESVLLELENIKDAIVFGVDNPIMGQVVATKIILNVKEDLKHIKQKIRKYCNNKLDSYKIPVYIEIIEGKSISERFKKIRK